MARKRTRPLASRTGRTFILRKAVTASAPWKVAVTMNSPTGAMVLITQLAMIGPMASPMPRISSMPPATRPNSPSLAKSFACATAMA